MGRGVLYRQKPGTPHLIRVNLVVVGAACPNRIIGQGKFFTKHMAIKKYDSAQGLVLGRSRNSPFDSKVGDKWLNFRLAYFMQSGACCGREYIS